MRNARVEYKTNMKHLLTAIAVTILFLILPASCASPPDAPPVEEPVEEPVVEEPVVEEPAEEDPAVEEPAEEEPVVEEPAEEEPVTVSEERYEQTFTEVEAVIGELNGVVRDRDYEAWRDYLTDRYVTYYSNGEVLDQQSQRPILQRNNIVLEDLEDFFTYVFVPSRANLRLDDIVFLSDDTVEAIMIIQEQRYVLYLLKQVEGRWKIDTF